MTRLKFRLAKQILHLHANKYSWFWAMTGTWQKSPILFMSRIRHSNSTAFTFSQSVDCHFFGLVLSQEVVLAHFHWLCSLLLQLDCCVFYKGNVLTWLSVWCDRAHSMVPGASMFPHHLSHSLHSVPTKLTQQANSAWTQFSLVYLQSQSICQTGGSNSWHESST